MKAFCRQEGHTDKVLSGVCTNSKCPHNSLCCFNCLKSLHRDCLPFMLDINDINKRVFTNNIGWIVDQNIAEAIQSIEKNKLTESKEQILTILKENVDHEFTMLIHFFMEKIEEAKEKVYAKIKEVAHEENLNIEEFFRKLKNLYNFDSLLNILEPLKKDEVDINTINNNLRDFFKQINVQEDKHKELKKLAQKVTCLTNNFLQVDLEPFKKFKNSLNFDILAQCALEKKWLPQAWTWSPLNKSNKIALSQNNLVATRDNSFDCDVGVIGDMEFTNSKWKWEVEVSTGRNDKKWICFGVIESQSIDQITLERFPCHASYGLSTKNQVFGLKQVNVVQNLDNKKFLCELDLDIGSFTISYEGKILAQERASLKGKKFVPFVALCSYRNSVRLNTLV